MLTRVQLVENILIIAGLLPQKKLQKLAYLAEIRYAEKYGARLSDFHSYAIITGHIPVI